MKDDKALLGRLNDALTLADHAHLLNLLKMHIEKTSFEAYKRIVLDGVLVVTAEKGASSDDYRVKSFQLAPSVGTIPAYLRQGIEEVLRVLNSKVEIVSKFELYSSTDFDGGYGTDWFSFTEEGGRLTLMIVSEGYDEALCRLPRTKHGVAQINGQSAYDSALIVVKVFALFTGVFVTIGSRQAVPNAGPLQLFSGSSELRRVQAKRGKVTQYYHDDEQLLEKDDVVRALKASRKLSATAKLRLSRSLHWIERFEGQTVSDYMLFSAIAIESLIDVPQAEECEHCGGLKLKEGATAAYRQFLTAHCSGPRDKMNKLAGDLYAARSDIVHSGRLSSTDDPGKTVMKAFSSVDDKTRLFFPVTALQQIWREVILHWLESQIE